MKKIIFLSIEDIKTIHWFQIDLYGGTHEIREHTLLESAAMHPQATFEGQYLYENCFQMAAAYAHSLIKNHPFLDGNKRVGIETMALFLMTNDISLKFKKDELFELGIAIATSQMDIPAIAQFLENKTKIVH